MTEYTLKFKDLEEGKTYLANNGRKYMIIQGLLWSYMTGDWSGLTHNQVSQIKFKEFIKISDEEKQLLSLIDNMFEWIARDKNGSVYIYTDKPFIDGTNWEIVTELGLSKRLSLECFNFNFDFLSWEDEEPNRISDLLD